MFITGILRATSLEPRRPSLRHRFSGLSPLRFTASTTRWRMGFGRWRSSPRLTAFTGLGSVDVFDDADRAVAGIIYTDSEFRNAP